MMTIKPKQGNTTLTPTLSSRFKVDMRNTYRSPGNARPYRYHFLDLQCGACLLREFAFRWGKLRWINGTVCGRVSKLYKRETG